MLFTGASASVKGYAQSAPFAMGKFALRGLAQSLARELSPQGIHVATLSSTVRYAVPVAAMTRASRMLCSIGTRSPSPTSISSASRAAPGPGRSNCGPGSNVSRAAGCQFQPSDCRVAHDHSHTAPIHRDALDRDCAIPAALVQAGFEVSLLTPRNSLAEKSRFLSKVGYLPDNATFQQWVIAFAGAVKATAPRIVLPCDDMAFRLLAMLMHSPRGLQPDMQVQLASLIRESLGDPDYYDISVDKTLLPSAAEAIGVRVPPYEIATTPEMAATFAAAHGYPIVLKRGHGFAGQGVAICANRGRTHSSVRGIHPRECSGSWRCEREQAPGAGAHSGPRTVLPCDRLARGASGRMDQREGCVQPGTDRTTHRHSSLQRATHTRRRRAGSPGTSASADIFSSSSSSRMTTASRTCWRSTAGSRRAAIVDVSARSIYGAL